MRLAARVFLAAGRFSGQTWKVQLFQHGFPFVSGSGCRSLRRAFQYEAELAAGFQKPKGKGVKHRKADNTHVGSAHPLIKINSRYKGPRVQINAIARSDRESQPGKTFAGKSNEWISVKKNERRRDWKREKRQK